MKGIRRTTTGRTKKTDKIKKKKELWWTERRKKKGKKEGQPKDVWQEEVQLLPWTTEKINEKKWKIRSAEVQHNCRPLMEDSVDTCPHNRARSEEALIKCPKENIISIQEAEEKHPFKVITTVAVPIVLLLRDNTHFTQWREGSRAKAKKSPVLHVVQEPQVGDRWPTVTWGQRVHLTFS